MNYIRGAFSAASQYYTSLPPINPSTLTGAIDVIVIERPVEDGKGETELVCSPFHVRFGKWQVLRPGEKKVKVFVNGLPIPFDMKIGEAGEAFFVVETDEEVPDDLLTSPILGPTKVGEELEPPTGRFGSRDVREDSQDPESVRHKRNTKNSSEPPFLDLTSSDSRAQSPVSSRTPSPIPSSPSSPSDRRFSTPPTSEESAPQTPSISPPSLAATPSSILGPNGMPSKASISAPTDEATKMYRSGDAVMEVTQSQSIMGSDNPEPIFNARISSEPQEGAEPLTPVYGHDVVLDMAGYHYAPPMEQGDDAEGDRGRAGKADTRGSTPQKARRNSESTLLYGDRFPVTGRSSTIENAQSIQSIRQQDVSAFPPPRHPFMGAITTSKSEQTPPTLDHSQFPSSAPDDSVMGSERPPRANSEPPEVLLVTPSSSSPQEYAWTFPQPPLSHGKLLTEATPTNSKSKDLETPTEASPPPSRMPPSEAIFGSEGRLMPGENEHVFWVDIDGRRFSFELSLCGRLEGTHEVNDAAKFENAKIPYATFVDDPTMPDNENLVMRWNDVYISQRDSSPLMGALSLWRETAAQPTRPSSPSPLGASPTSSSQPTLVHSRGSSWALWWSRSERDLLTASNPPPLPSTVTPQSDKSPSLVASTSQPIQTPPEVKTEPASPALNSYIPKASAPTTSPDLKTHYAKTLRLTSEQLKELHLNKGSNTITFSLASSGVIACTARIFVWDSSDHIVVSDIDGTITKSDALGHVFTLIGRDWTHLGVAKLYTDIAKNGYKIMYLTSRAIGQADSTRDYLKGIKQGDYQLPEGPVIMSPDRLIVSLHREVIMRKPEVFKMACLRDIQRLFGHAASKRPFYAGFGNRITDALSYRSVNIPSSRIFTIDSTGDVKLELLELAGYKSSYIHMTSLVDQMFPPVNQKFAADFTDFNFWRAPIEEYELPNLDPPSPTLSASSDTYRLSRLRNFSLRGKSSSQSLADNNNKPQSDPSKGELAPQGNARPSSPLASPALSASDMEERKDLKKSSSSTGLHRNYQLDMPRPLDDRLLEDPDFDEVASYHEDTRDGPEEPDDYDESESDDHQHHDPDGEETFDDDLLATGEMDNIPFL